jgi:hypothetical protein
MDCLELKAIYKIKYEKCCAGRYLGRTFSFSRDEV